MAHLLDFVQIRFSPKINFYVPKTQSAQFAVKNRTYLYQPNSAIHEEWFVCKSHRSNGELPFHLDQDGAHWDQSRPFRLLRLQPVHQSWGETLIRLEVQGVLLSM